MSEGDRDSREQLGDTERLGDVVVGPEVEGLDFSGLQSPGRQDDHRHARPLTDALEDGDAVDIGQAEVQEDEVGKLGEDGAERRLSGLRFRDPVALVGEGSPQEPAHRGVVFDHEDARRG